jgi:hypothetical protein
MTFEGPAAARRGDSSRGAWETRPPISPIPDEGWWPRFRSQFLEMLGRHQEPEKVAASFAIGVAIAFSPLIGFHFLLALVVAVLLRLNKLDVILGTLVVNPLTLGPVSAVALSVGRFVLQARQEAVTRMPLGDFLRPTAWAQAGPAMKTIGIQWGVGMFTLSVVLGALTYLVLVRVIRSRRDRASMVPPDFAD